MPAGVIAGRDDRRDARAGRLHGVEPDQQGARRLRTPQDPHRDLGDDPEQPSEPEGRPPEEVAVILKASDLRHKLSSSKLAVTSGRQSRKHLSSFPMDPQTIPHSAKFIGGSGVGAAFR